MHAFHKQLLDEIKKHAGKGTSHSASDSYLSSGHYYYSISVPLKRSIARHWLKAHKDIEATELILLLESLFLGKSYEEKTMAGILLGYLSKQRREVDPVLLNIWLDNLVGWAEIDTLCQSNFTAKEFLANWKIWSELIQKFSQDKSISKRRASLVLLTGPVTESDNKDLADLAFHVIDTLKAEKDILITKAISWLLRNLIKHHKSEVQEYLNKNTNSLPKIAMRETSRKLVTGKK